MRLLLILIWLACGFFAAAGMLAEEIKLFPTLVEPVKDKLFWFGLSPILGIFGLLLATFVTSFFQYSFVYPWTKVE